MRLICMMCVYFSVGETASFECKVSAANLNVQWLKDNKILSGNNYRTSKRNDAYILELNSLIPEDAGLYTIVASNAKGESTSSSSTLNVLSGRWQHVWHIIKLLTLS